MCGPASHRLRSGPAADDRVFMAQPGSSGKQHSAATKLGLQRRRAAVRLRSRQSTATARRCRYPSVNGVRFHLTMKTSTNEDTRLMVAVMQQQLRQVGIALDIRTFESATFMADVVSGAFQLYSLRWIGGNEDPDIFDTAFTRATFLRQEEPKLLFQSEGRQPDRPGAARDRSRRAQEALRRNSGDSRKDVPSVNLCTSTTW